MYALLFSTSFIKQPGRKRTTFRRMLCKIAFKTVASVSANLPICKVSSSTIALLCNLTDKNHLE